MEDLYSRRNKSMPENLNYESLPVKLKNQIVHIWNNFFSFIKGDDDHDKLWEIIEEKIAIEHGKKTLLDDGLMRYRNSYKVEHYLLNNQDIDECLDVIEIVFRMVANAGKHFYTTDKSDAALKELNLRFLQNGVGFQFMEGMIVKVDSNLLHQDIIKPALNLLNAPEYTNANEEYLNAHEHFRKGRNKESLNECLKAFETTIKIICTKNQWDFDERDSASKLINVLIVNGFIPEYHSSHFNAIKQVLESGAPTIRNKNGAHGQGTVKIRVGDEMASYMINLTGAAIKYLVEVQKIRHAYQII